MITATDADIIKSISYLKEGRLGKASFISLETLARTGRTSTDVAPLEPCANSSCRATISVSGIRSAAFSWDTPKIGTSASSKAGTRQSSLPLKID
jgi:hypothetical protein